MKTYTMQRDPSQKITKLRLGWKTKEGDFMTATENLTESRGNEIWGLVEIGKGEVGLKQDGGGLTFFRKVSKCP